MKGVSGRLGMDRPRRGLVLVVLTGCAALAAAALAFAFLAAHPHAEGKRAHVGTPETLELPHGMQMSREQVAVAVAEIERIRREGRECKLLVFGVGHDAPFWAHANRHGVTVFLEDSLPWASAFKNLTIHAVTFSTRMGGDDGRFLRLSEAQREVQLRMDLPPSVTLMEWDIIIVDGPAGFDAAAPGRFQSLFMAAHLPRRHDALTVVDDCNRHIERAYADAFLGADNLFMVIPRSWRIVAAWNSLPKVYGESLTCLYRGTPPLHS